MGTGKRERVVRYDALLAAVASGALSEKVKSEIETDIQRAQLSSVGISRRLGSRGTHIHLHCGRMAEGCQSRSVRSCGHLLAAAACCTLYAARRAAR